MTNDKKEEITIEHLHKYKNRVETALDLFLPSTEKEPQEFHEAMRYAVLNGGKRLRAAFVYSVGKSLNADLEVLDKISAAMEMIHAFTLIHDDLPALDNQNLRRGKPSCHVAFGQATAILAGDALHNLAFSLIISLKKKINPEVLYEILNLTSNMVNELALGEVLDIFMENQTVSIKQLRKLYHLKTASFLSACIVSGALAANCQDKKILTNLKQFGNYIGVAFQIHDDILDIESSTEILGKTVGTDQLRNKPTYPELLGLDKAKEVADEMFQRGLCYLKETKIDTSLIEEVAKFVMHRKH